MAESKTATAELINDEIRFVCPHCGARHSDGNRLGKGVEKVKGTDRHRAYFERAFHDAFNSLPGDTVFRDKNKSGQRFREREFAAFMRDPKRWVRQKKFLSLTLSVRTVGRELDFLRFRGKTPISSCELKVYPASSTELFTVVADAVLKQMERLIRGHAHIVPHVSVILFGTKNESIDDLEHKMKTTIDYVHKLLRVKCVGGPNVKLKKGSYSYILSTWEVRLVRNCAS